LIFESVLGGYPPPGPPRDVKKRVAGARTVPETILHRFSDAFGRSGGPHSRLFGAVLGTFSGFFRDEICGYTFSPILDAFGWPGGQKRRVSGEARCGLYIVNNGSDRMSACFYQNRCRDRLRNVPDLQFDLILAPFWSPVASISVSRERFLVFVFRL